MSLENSHYDAFISYRHSDLDKFVAENLHKELEKFKLPGKLLKKGKGNGKKRITRVFRDKEELPITSNLAEPIYAALRNSEYLIVVCTPRLPESAWCQREIETFIELHGRDKVLAVLAEGSHQQSFPESILVAEQVVRDKDGFIHIEKKQIEPLAADVRGKNKREVRKRLKAEVLRLAAPMFGVSYDDLRQRHRERRLKKIIAVTSVIAAVFCIFSLISTTMAIMIKEQSAQIKEQTSQIVQRTEELKQQYQETFATQARLQAQNALDLLETGKRLEAIEAARTVLPDSGEDTTIPLTAEAQFALTKALYVYENGNSLLPLYTLKHDTDIVHMDIMEEASRLMTVDTNGTVYLYELETGRMLTKIRSKESHRINDAYAKYQCAFSDAETIAICEEDGISYYNIEEGRKLDSIADEYANYFAESGDRQYLAVQGFQGISMYNRAEKELLWSKEADFSRDISTTFVFSEQGDYFAYVQKAGNEKQNMQLYIVNSIDGEELCEFSLDYNIIHSMVFEGDMLYITASLYGESYSKTEKNGLLAVDVANRTVKWELPCVEEDFDEIHLTGGESPYIEITTYSDLYIINKADGIVQNAVTGDSEIVGFLTNGKDYYYYFTRAGEFVGGRLEGDDAFVGIGGFKSSSGNLKTVRYGGGIYATAAYASQNVTVYAYAAGINSKEVFNFEDSILEVDISSDGAQLLVRTSSNSNIESIHMYDCIEQKIIWSKELEENNAKVFFTEDGKECYAVLADYTLSLYNIEDNELVLTARLEEGEDSLHLASEIAVNMDRTFFYIESEGKICQYDMKGTLINTLTLQETESSNPQYCVKNDASQVAVVSAKEDAIVFYSFTGERLPERISVNASYVSFLAYSGDGKALFINYQDGSVEIYDTEQNKLIKAWEDMKLSMKAVRETKDGGYTVLEGIGAACILNDRYEKMAAVNDDSLLSETGQTLYTYKYRTLYETPFYTYDNLIQEADRQLSKAQNNK